MKLIPLSTKFTYYCTEDGRIFREQKELKGWAHRENRSGKCYHRFGLYMKNGKRKFFFGQRLVAMCYHNLLLQPDRIVRHLTEDSFNNHKDAIIVGTHVENQTIDRIEAGTYMNRGGKHIEEDVGF